MRYRYGYLIVNTRNDEDDEDEDSMQVDSSAPSGLSEGVTPEGVVFF